MAQRDAMISEPRRSTPGRLSAALGVAAFLSACALSHLQAPVITLVSVELADLQIQEQHFTVRLHAQNPNDRPLPIKSVSATLQIAGVEVGQGKSAAPFSVPAHGDAEFDLLVTTNIATSLPNLLRRVLQRGQLPEYQVSGWVNPDMALLPPIPFAKSGQIVIPQ